MGAFAERSCGVVHDRVFRRLRLGKTRTLLPRRQRVSQTLVVPSAVRTVSPEHRVPDYQ